MVELPSEERVVVFVDVLVLEFYRNLPFIRVIVPNPIKIIILNINYL